MSLFANIPLVVLAVVLVLIAVRKVGRFQFHIWQSMLLGAVIVVLHGDMPLPRIPKAISADVMLYLFGMFVVGEALHQSGYLYRISHRLFARAATLDRVVLIILFGIGGLAALLMNDTLAIICTPLMLYLARRNDVSPKLLLLTLAFAVTTGSVISPIGSPHSLLIAINSHVPNPFVTYIAYLGIPTVMSIFVAYGMLKLYYREYFDGHSINHHDEPISDPHLARLSRISIWITLVMIGLKVIAPFVYSGLDFSLTFIALLAALPILLLSPRRLSVLKNIDWRTLIFFAAMFVLMDSVWQTGFFQARMANAGFDPKSVPMILVVSTVISQLVSNVPFVALYIPMLADGQQGTIAAMALVAGSTIAGNLFILGAASNVIIIQNAEKQGETLTFWEFARIGLPLTAVQLLIYWLWLTLVSHFVL